MTNSRQASNQTLTDAQQSISANSSLETMLAEPARPGEGKLQLSPTASIILNVDVPVEVEQQPIPVRGPLDLASLLATTALTHDYAATATELGHFQLDNTPAIRVAPKVGQHETFSTTQGRRQAELVYADELAYYWVESGLTVDRQAIIASAERLRRRHYPQLSEVLGRERRPGIDGEDRFHVLLLLGPPEVYELGFFMEEDEYPRALFEESNQREIVYLNMSRLVPDTPLYDGTLVHEVQHLIQWNLDANEDKWLNEALSQVAETLVGLETVDVRPHREQPDLRLDRWSNEPPEVYAHYAGAYLFLLYLWEQLGDPALSELARHPANGLASVHAVLAGFRPDTSLEAFAANWAVANLLDGNSADPRFGYRSVALDPPFFANRVRRLPFETVTEIDQYAVDYIDLDFSGTAVITFAGDTVAPLVAESPPHSETIWYAPPANSSRMQLVAAIDLSGLANASLDFDAWYDLEPGYDFAYVGVSADGGQSWELLTPAHSVNGAYGPGFGGSSAGEASAGSGWVHESLSLDAYAGQSVLVRFDVATDFEVTGEGFAVANLRVPDLFDQPAWRAIGFVETGRILPQQWAVRLIRQGSPPEVIEIPLNEQNQAQLVVELGAAGGVLVVMPLTPYVTAPARYWLHVGN